MPKQERHDTVGPQEKYEEYKLLPQFWAWVLLLAWSASLILWAHWIHTIIPKTERFWDYGQAAFTPAESVYSSVTLPEKMPALEQMPTLPEARPLRLPPPAPESER